MVFVNVIFFYVFFGDDVDKNYLENYFSVINIIIKKIEF